jgi:phage terminase small subunit
MHHCQNMNGLWNPPEWMPEGAKAIWHSTAPILVGKGILLPQQRIWFAMFCTTWAHVQDAKQGAATAATATERATHAQIETDFREVLDDLLSDIECDSGSNFIKRFMKSVQ